MIFQNRSHAGTLLAEALKKYQGDGSVIILGLPRGGVVTAAAAAKELQVPLDILVPRKIGAPGNPEFAIGAISEEGEGVFDQHILDLYEISKEYLKTTIEDEKKETLRRLKTYRGNRPSLDLGEKTAILVDDGIATGATMRAAILSARKKGAKKIVVATPVIAPDTLEKLRNEADEVMYLSAPEYFAAVGRFYEAFEQTSDQEVISLLHI